jgi:hypothetical protein
MSCVRELGAELPEIPTAIQSCRYRLRCKVVPATQKEGKSINRTTDGIYVLFMNLDHWRFALHAYHEVVTFYDHLVAPLYISVVPANGVISQPTTMSSSCVSYGTIRIIVAWRFPETQ